MATQVHVAWAHMSTWLYCYTFVINERLKSIRGFVASKTLLFYIPSRISTLFTRHRRCYSFCMRRGHHDTKRRCCCTVAPRLQGPPHWGKSLSPHPLLARGSFLHSVHSTNGGSPEDVNAMMPKGMGALSQVRCFRLLANMTKCAHCVPATIGIVRTTLSWGRDGTL